VAAASIRPDHLKQDRRKFPLLTPQTASFHDAGSYYLRLRSRLEQTTISYGFVTAAYATSTANCRSYGVAPPAKDFDRVPSRKIPNAPAFLAKACFLA